MSGTGAGGQVHPQPPIAPIVTLGPTNPKPDKSLEFNRRARIYSSVPYRSKNAAHV
jgi:hypothetical protein